ncbi:MAG: hypothetical protein IJ532_00500 [Alphaproteobacteria bacterium]|nr:hypothetical protein [Alphaproteobacteria bacterium]
MITKIKERVKAWKRFYAQDCKNADENSSWREILTELEYYSFRKFYPFSEQSIGQQKLWNAIQSIGTFSDEEKEFLEEIPAYSLVRIHLDQSYYQDNFADKFNDVDVFCVCLASDEDIPLREYTVVTDRRELWDLEIYIFRYSRFRYLCRHGIIRFAEKPPIDFVEPKNIDDDLPF